MDQVAAAGIKLLAAYKKQLDAAKEKVEIARRLANKIEIFEVTITMIPRRGSSEHFKAEIREETKNEDTKHDGTKNEGADEKAVTKITQVKNYVKEAVNYGVENAKTMVIDKAQDILKQTPFALVADLIVGFSDIDKSPILEMRQGEILDMMRRNGAKDLEVSFAAMRFIVQSALTIIKNAVEDVQLIQIPNCCWLIQPWKVQAQNEVGARLDGHMDAIDKFNGQLQSAISVASYCISLEQLENVLNATSMLACMELRDFWKRKIGISNIRAKMDDVVESFLDEVENEIAAYKKNNYHVKEKFVKMKTTPEVALGRFLSSLWNSNGDAFITVYELNTNTLMYAQKFGKDCKVLNITTEAIFAMEKLFYSQIVFFPISIDPGKDKTFGTADDKLVLDAQKLREHHQVDLHPNDRVIVLQPFQRLRVLCTMPNFDPDMYPYDCVALMKYEKISSLQNLVAASEYTLEEVPGSRTFLNPETNEQLYGDDLYKWNAPKVFKNREPKDNKKAPKENDKPPRVTGIDGKRIGPNNFEITKFSTSSPAEGEGEEDAPLASATKASSGPTYLDSSNVTLEHGGITTTTSILYTPLVSKPGFYSIRLVLDDLELKDHEDIRSVNKKKLIISNKSYYYNRNVDVQTTYHESVCSSRDIFTKEGLGEDNIKEYYQIALKILELDEIEARRAREFSEFAQIQRDRNQLKLALSKLSPATESGPARETSTGVVPPSVELANAREASDNVSSSANVPNNNAGSVVVDSSNVKPIVTSTTDVVTTSTGDYETVTMTVNPMARPTAAPAFNEAKAIQSRIENLLNELITKSPTGDNSKYSKYLKEKKTSVSTIVDSAGQARSNSAGQVRSLEKIEISLRRLNLALQLRGVIERVSFHIDGLQEKWFDSMMIVNMAEVKSQVKKKGSDNENLKLVDESLRQYRALMQIQKLLLPTELQGHLSVISTTSSKFVLPPHATNPKHTKEESRYLVDFAADRNSIAKTCLDHLFVKYYIVKMSVYELDSKESMWQRNIRRLELLTSKMTDLRQSLFEEAKTTSKEPSKEPSKDPSAAPTSPPALTAEQVLAEHEKHRERNPVTYRAEVLQHLDEVVSQIELMIDSLFNEASDPKKKSQISQIIKRAEQCNVVIMELKAIREMASYLPPSSSPTVEEELQISRQSTKPPMGLIVHVEDKNALAWGEAEPNELDVEYDSSSDSDGEGEERKERTEGEEKSKIKYRPMIDYYYPYPAKSSISKNIARIYFGPDSLNDSSHLNHLLKQGHKKLETAVFFNIASNSGGSKKKKEEDGEKKQVPVQSTLIPSYIAILVAKSLQKDEQDPQQLDFLDYFEIESKGEYLLVDFYPSVREVVKRKAPDFDLKNADVNANLIVMLVANVPNDKLDAAKKENIHIWKTNKKAKHGDGNDMHFAYVDASPILTYNIFENAEADDEEESDDDFHDDSSDDDDDDSDDDEYDDAFEVEMARDAAADVEQVLSKLHKHRLHYHNHHWNHIMELCHTDTLYGGSMYICCDLCRRRAYGYIYHCIECNNYDAHPQCLHEDDFYELFEKEDVIQPSDVIDPLTLDKKEMFGYVEKGGMEYSGSESDSDDGESLHFLRMALHHEDSGNESGSDDGQPAAENGHDGTDGDHEDSGKEKDSDDDEELGEENGEDEDHEDSGGSDDGQPAVGNGHDGDHEDSGDESGSDDGKDVEDVDGEDSEKGGDSEEEEPTEENVEDEVEEDEDEDT